MAPTGAWLWGHLGVETTTVDEDVPWSCSSPAQPGEMSSSGDTWTGQSRWKGQPTKLCKPLMLRWLLGSSLAQGGSANHHMDSTCTLRDGPALCQVKSVWKTSKKTHWQQRSHPTASLLRFCPMEASGKSKCGLEGDEGDSRLSGCCEPVPAPR